MKQFQIATARQKVPILTYESDIPLSVGDIVISPFQNSEITGIILKENDSITKEKFKIKKVISKLDNLKIKASTLSFIESFSKYYIIDISSCIKMLLPIPLKQNIKTRKIIQETNINLPELNHEQEESLENISQSEKVTVLEGVTGSGKTEVYFHLIKKYIQNNKQILLMLPEIGLTKQILNRFEKTFGFKPALWHSSVTPAVKRDIYFGINSGEVKVVIGTRSSLFLPFKDLGLIVIDEEHDGSYKQEENNLYNARDAAILRANFENTKIVLVSATPSLETYNNIQNGKYSHTFLKTRFSQNSMPNFEIIDMRSEAKENIISPKLSFAIKEGLANGHQSILFINRRGYAPLLLCRHCGYRYGCIECSSWLVYHRHKSELICHHCGYFEDYKKTCSECGSEELAFCGSGAERIFEEASNLFPDAKIELFTKEQTTSSKALEELLNRIENGEVDILIGTQILTKGYHFPNVTIVGIMDTDFSLANIDLKANERCFQILSQVSGRAGRGSVAGTAYIQTYFPDNPLFKILQNGLSEEFYKEELSSRERNFLPPFSRIIAIIVAGDNEIETRYFAQKVRDYSIKTERVKILGPAPATMSKLKGKFRYRLLYICDKKYNIQNYISNLLINLKDHSNHTIRVEVDPYSFY